MKTINWTAGNGAEISVSVTAAFELNRQGIRKTTGRKVIVLTATINGKSHACPLGLQPVKHPVAVAKIGDIGLTQANYDRVRAAIAEVEQTIESHNAACDAHEDKLMAVDTVSAAITRKMSAGE